MAANCKYYSSSGMCVAPGQSGDISCSYDGANVNECAVYRMVTVRAAGGTMEDAMRAAEGTCYPEPFNRITVGSGSGRNITDDQINAMFDDDNAPEKSHAESQCQHFKDGNCNALPHDRLCVCCGPESGDGDCLIYKFDKLRPKHEKLWDVFEELLDERGNSKDGSDELLRSCLNLLKTQYETGVELAKFGINIKRKRLKSTNKHGKDPKHSVLETITGLLDPNAQMEHVMDYLKYRADMDDVFSDHEPGKPYVEKSSKCFLATATCGHDSREVTVLRVFRDEVLRQSSAGRIFIGTYERLSPPVAEFIREREIAKALVRHTIVKPACVVARRWATKAPTT